MKLSVPILEGVVEDLRLKGRAVRLRPRGGDTELKD
jgi:hypothetical protein